MATLAHRRRLARTLKAHGVVYPWRTLRAARKANVYPWIACTILELESAGGHNVFGHDPTWSIPTAWKGSRVTAARYAYYRSRRGAYGLQGVGPCQLTSASLQDAADRRGGCWRVVPNMVVGFRFVHGLIAQYGSVQLGFQHYNGSGPAAEAYGRHALARVEHWKTIIRSVH
jgi:hypothetical protein